MAKRPMIVGVSGVTCGGKTSLCDKLKNLYEGSVIINQDNFFREETDPSHIWLDVRPGVRHQNWEHLVSIDWKAFEAEINRTLNEWKEPENGLLIIEGHIIFCYDFPFKFDKKYFLTLDKEECWQRRKVRTYIPNDPEGYFDICIWPMYLQNKCLMESMHDNIVYLDGTLPKQLILDEVIKDLQKSEYTNALQ
ncbi:nicotinamide riboside kinase 1-like protein [Leptotrombidium deliense]|uniref:Nicotinamide riboside kinase 1-like protein n=1 Tax=Leptotrombidium deliense TaxID=299467 RepID=A0A443S4K4_9ACAR|nr:nicotinamide riboside kinase 1-like protein [Leptotrombidium deliense]